MPQLAQLVLLISKWTKNFNIKENSQRALEVIVKCHNADNLLLLLLAKKKVSSRKSEGHGGPMI